jgi:ABC-type multidrug transport system fused ATPase/permease subunit
MPVLPEHLRSWREFLKLKEVFQETKKHPTEGFTLAKAMVKSYYCSFLMVMVFLGIYVGIQSAAPFVTALMIRYISHKADYEAHYGILLFAGILLMQIVKSICDTNMGYRMGKVGVNLTNGLTLLIFSKSLKYPSVAEKEFEESDIVNYSQVDAERLASGGNELATLLTCPIQIVIGVLLMYHFIGISFLAGIGVLLLTIGATYLTSRKSYEYNKQILRKKDERMRATQEMLDTIRYIKINAIEKYFYGKVDEKRMEEIGLYKRKGLMDTLNVFVYWLACPLILSATFATYVWLGNQMSSEVAFTTIIIFTTLQVPIRILPNSISAIIQIFTSVKRIEKYLYAQEISTKHHTEVNDQSLEQAIVIERGNFYYKAEKKEGEQQGKLRKGNK